LAQKNYSISLATASKVQQAGGLPVVPATHFKGWRCLMARNVADAMWEMLKQAGVKRCYGIIGDALNPVIGALRRNGKIDFVHVRHEEYGVFAAVADAYLTGNPVVVCGTAGPGVTHLFNGLVDALKEGAPIIAIAGDVETSVMDTAGLENLILTNSLRPQAHTWAAW
jgi:thiamine pyrophosphate-dependent acetolactate synthase large subunit-like protein